MKKLLCYLLLSLFSFSFFHSKAQDVIDIPVVFHILYTNPSDSFSVEKCRSYIEDSVSIDFRRKNWDTIYTQLAYRPIAADTKIQFHLATVDPNGAPTQGVEWRLIDPGSDTLTWQNLFYTNLEGLDSWDACKYLNIWITHKYMGGEHVSGSTIWTPKEKQGLVCNAQTFSHGNQQYRYFVHQIGHMFGVDQIGWTSECVDSDGISDTPIQIGAYGPCREIDTIIQDQQCDSLPLGRLYCNYMGMVNGGGGWCLNMFTQGQADEMNRVIETYYPGYIDNQYCLASTQELALQVGFNIYPNPTNGRFNLDMENHAGVVAVNIYNAVGSQVYSQSAIEGRQVTISPDLAKGVYIVEVSSKKGIGRKKLIVQ